jgi:hypothetical protein
MPMGIAAVEYLDSQQESPRPSPRRVLSRSAHSRLWSAILEKHGCFLLTSVREVFRIVSPEPRMAQAREIDSEE